MLSNAYFVAKFRFDTAENEPAKNLQNFRKMHFSKMQLPTCPTSADLPSEAFHDLLQVRSVHLRREASCPARYSTDHICSWPPFYRRHGRSCKGAAACRGTSIPPASRILLKTGIGNGSIGQSLQGSLSAVSKPNFASKYSLELGSI